MATIQDLFTALHRADEAGNTEDAKRIAEIIHGLGYGERPAAPKEEAPKKRSMTEAATDVLSSFGSGIGQFAQLPGQIGTLAGIYGPEEQDTGLQGLGKELQQFSESKKTDILKQKEAARAQKIQEADGFLNEAKAAISSTITDPALLTSFFAEQVPNLIGSFGFGAVTKGGTKLLMRNATEQALQKAGVRGAIGGGAIMQGADIGSDTYEETLARLKKNDPNIDPAKANELALSAGRKAAIEAAALSLGVSYLPGGATIERALVGRNLPGAAGFVRGTLGETFGEGIEEGGGALAKNLAMAEVVPGVDIGKGVGAAAGLGALGGAMMGAPASLVSGAPLQEPAPTLPQVRPRPAVAPEGLATLPTAGGFDAEQAAALRAQAVQAEQDRLAGIEAGRLAEEAAAQEAVRGMPGFAGTPDINTELLGIARDDRAQEQKRLEAERRAQIKEIENTQFSTDPFQDQIMRNRALQQIAPAPAVETTAAPEPIALSPEEQEAQNIKDFLEQQQRIQKAQAQEKIGKQRKGTVGPFTPEEKEAMGIPVEERKAPAYKAVEHPENKGFVLDEQGNPQLADLAQGAQKFKSKAQADEMKGNLADYKVIAMPGGGFAISPKTEAELKREGASKLGVASVGKKGMPLSAHEMIASEGGLNADAAKNANLTQMRVGNRYMVAGKGKGLTADEVREKLESYGYVQPGEIDDNQALQMVANSVKNPRYTPDGYEQISSIEREQQAAEAERADLAGQLEMPVAEEMGYLPYQATPEEMNDALSRLTDAGLDADAITEQAFEDTKNGTDEDFIRRVVDLSNEALGVGGRRGEVGAAPIMEELQQEKKKDEGYFTNPEGKKIQAQLEGKNFDQAVDWMIKNAPNRFQKLVGEKIKNMASALKREGVTLTFDVQGGNARNSSLHEAKGVTTFIWSPADKGGTKVFLFLNGEPAFEGQRGFPSGMNYQTLQHEMLHVVTRSTTRFLPRNHPVIQELNSLFNTVVEKYNSDARAGKLPDVLKQYYKRINNVLATPDELISWGLTDGEFQKYLDDIKVGPKQTVMSKLVQLVRELMGLPKPFETALDRLVKTTEAIIDTSLEEVKEGMIKEKVAFGPTKQPTTKMRQESLFSKRVQQMLREDLMSKQAAPERTQLGNDTMEMLAGIGRTVAEPEPGYTQKITDGWKNVRDNPQATRDAAYSKFRRFLDQAETWTFSSDAGLNNQIRNEVMNSMAGQEQKIGMLLNTSLSQTAHSDAVANLFIMEGNIKYDTELHKWVGVKDENNIINLSKKLDEIAEKLGLNKQEVELMAHTAFEARRAQELNRFNEQIERQAAAIKEQAKIDRAEGRSVAASALNDKANNLLRKKKIVMEEDGGHVTRETLETGLRLYDMHPGLKEVTKIWNGIRKNALDRMVESGLYTEEEAKMLMDAADYVPFFREDQIEEGKGPKEFLRSLAVQADKRLKGSNKPVNDIFDNMVRWTQYAINRGVRNRSGVALAQTAEQMGLATKIKNPSNPNNIGMGGVTLGNGGTAFATAQQALQYREQNNLQSYNVLEVKDDDGKSSYFLTPYVEEKNVAKVWENGKQVEYAMEDPLFVEAFRGLESVAIPTVKFFSKFADVLRQSVVLYPLFSLAQVPQDSFAAMFTSGLKPQHALTIPVRAVKEFIQTLRGKSKAHEELKNVGAVGVRDFTSAIIRADAEIASGLKADKGFWAKVHRKLGNWAMAADNAVRQATYEAAMAQGLSKAEAIEKAFEIFNVRRRGNSQMLAMAGQVIPFFNAYLAAQHVAYRTLTGVGTSPTERKAALQTLAATTGSVMALSLLYAMMNGDDEDYLNKPTPTRDRLLMVPGTGGWVSIPLRADIFALPKVLAEHTYLLMTDNGYEDPAKFRASMASLLANSIFSPTPVPQAIKPLAEAIMNYDFFQQKPLVGTFQQRKELKQQFEDSTSEFAKVLGSTNMVSPIVADHFIRGMFGSFGGLFLYMTNPILADMAGKPRPTMSYQDALATIPNASGFVSKEYEVALRKDFYALKEVTDRVSATISDMKTRSPQELADYLSDEDVRARYALTPAVNQIAQQLTTIRKAVTAISQAPEERMDEDEKQRQIKQLREAELRLLKGVNLKALRERANI